MKIANRMMFGDATARKHVHLMPSCLQLKQYRLRDEIKRSADRIFAMEGQGPTTGRFYRAMEEYENICNKFDTIGRMHESRADIRIIWENAFCTKGKAGNVILSLFPIDIGGSLKDVIGKEKLSPIETMRREAIKKYSEIRPFAVEIMTF